MAALAEFPMAPAEARTNRRPCADRENQLLIAGMVTARGVTRMDLPTAHWARTPPMGRERRRNRSPRKVAVRDAPRAAWVQ
jgi:hypothetical protein